MEESSELEVRFDGSSLSGLLDTEWNEGNGFAANGSKSLLLSSWGKASLARDDVERFKANLVSGRRGAAMARFELL